MTIRQLDWRNSHKPVTDPIDPARAGQSSLLKWITMIWLAGMLVLLPLDFVKLPLNMIPVDCWILMGLPVLWLFFVRGSHIMNVSYAIAMWVILVASIASTFAAPAPKNSLVVILKEIYAYIWFVTLTAVLVRLNARDFRRLLVVWSGMVFLHGFVIIAQFLSPDFWQFTTGLAGKSSEFEIYRPSGLFMNANSAAFFQLLGFVPLVLVSPSKRAGMILGVLLLPTMLATGSMGATVAFIAGLAVALMAIFLSGHLALITRMFVQLTIVVSLLGGGLYFVVSHNQRYQAHFERILVGRAERSSEGRFDLWQGGIEVFLDQGVFIWGVGPENHRELGERGKQLHNDFLAFLVERGLIGVLGLVLFAGIAVSRAAYMVLIHNKYPDRAQLTVVVFLAAMTAAAVESLTHQTFHFRELWLILAFQEALIFKMMSPENGIEPTTTQVLNESPPNFAGSVGQPDVIGG